jgi:hypothetical protein
MVTKLAATALEEVFAIMTKGYVSALTGFLEQVASILWLYYSDSEVVNQSLVGETIVYVHK